MDIAKVKTKKTANAYMGYAMYCLGMSKKCSNDGDLFLSDYYYREYMEYVELYIQLMHSLVVGNACN